MRYSHKNSSKSNSAVWLVNSTRKCTQKKIDLSWINSLLFIYNNLIVFNIIPQMQKKSFKFRL